MLRGDGKGSKYEVAVGRRPARHGLAPSFWAFDELARRKDRILLDNLQTAMGKRTRSLGVVISTQAANDIHPLSQLIDDGLRDEDTSMVVHLLAAPADADPFDPDVIRSVNPAFGKFLDEADVLAEAERARRMPSFESAFRNLRLNQRIAPFGRDQLLTPEVWAVGDAPIDEAMFSDGRPVFGGLDLSSTVDLTALVLAAEDDGGIVHLMPRAWTPAETLAERIITTARPTMPGCGRATDRGAGQGDRLRLGRAGAGRAIRAHEPRPGQLRPLGHQAVQAGAGPARHHGAAGADGPGLSGHVAGGDEFQLLVATRRFRHGNHPLLRWCFANAVVTRDAADNCKLDKAKAYGRIDVAVAAVMAVGAMKATTPQVEIAAMIA